MREVFQNPHFVVTVDDERRMLRRMRTDQAFSSLPEAEASYEAMLQAAEPYRRARYALLADVRLAPPRNDPAFEAMVARFFPRLYGGYRRAAALVKTQAGKLQLTRINDAHHQSTGVFTDEAAALAYLESDTGSSLRSSDIPPRPSSRRGI